MSSRTKTKSNDGGTSDRKKHKERARDRALATGADGALSFREEEGDEPIIVNDDQWSTFLYAVDGGDEYDQEPLIEVIDGGIRRKFSVITYDAIIANARSNSKIPLCAQAKYSVDHGEPVADAVLVGLLRRRMLEDREEGIADKEAALREAERAREAAKERERAEREALQAQLRGGSGSRVGTAKKVSSKPRKKSAGNSTKRDNMTTPDSPHESKDKTKDKKKTSDSAAKKKRDKDKRKNKATELTALDDEPDDGPDIYYYIVGFPVTAEFICTLDEAGIPLGAVVRVVPTLLPQFGEGLHEDLEGWMEGASSRMSTPNSHRKKSSGGSSSRRRDRDKDKDKSRERDRERDRDRERSSKEKERHKKKGKKEKAPQTDDEADEEETPSAEKVSAAPGWSLQLHLLKLACESAPFGSPLLAVVWIEVPASADPLEATDLYTFRIYDALAKKKVYDAWVAGMEPAVVATARPLGEVDMSRYTAIVDAVPEESVTVALVLHAMLEQVEVSARSPDTTAAARAAGAADTDLDALFDNTLESLIAPQPKLSTRRSQHANTLRSAASAGPLSTGRVSLAQSNADNVAMSAAAAEAVNAPPARLCVQNYGDSTAAATMGVIGGLTLGEISRGLLALSHVTDASQHAQATATSSLSDDLQAKMERSQLYAFCRMKPAAIERALELREVGALLRDADPNFVHNVIDRTFSEELTPMALRQVFAAAKRTHPQVVSRYLPRTGVVAVALLAPMDHKRSHSEEWAARVRNAVGFGAFVSAVNEGYTFFDIDDERTPFVHPADREPEPAESEASHRQLVGRSIRPLKRGGAPEEESESESEEVAKWPRLAYDMNNTLVRVGTKTRTLYPADGAVVKSVVTKTMSGDHVRTTVTLGDATFALHRTPESGPSEEERKLAHALRSAPSPIPQGSPNSSFDGSSRLASQRTTTRSLESRDSADGAESGALSGGALSGLSGGAVSGGASGVSASQVNAAAAAAMAAELFGDDDDAGEEGESKPPTTSLTVTFEGGACAAVRGRPAKPLRPSDPAARKGAGSGGGGGGGVVSRVRSIASVGGEVGAGVSGSAVSGSDAAAVEADSSAGASTGEPTNADSTAAPAKRTSNKGASTTNNNNNNNNPTPTQPVPVAVTYTSASGVVVQHSSEGVVQISTSRSIAKTATAAAAAAAAAAKTAGTTKHAAELSWLNTTTNLDASLGSVALGASGDHNNNNNNNTTLGGGGVSGGGTLTSSGGRESAASRRRRRKKGVKGERGSAAAVRANPEVGRCVVGNASVLVFREDGEIDVWMADGSTSVYAPESGDWVCTDANGDRVRIDSAGRETECPSINVATYSHPTSDDVSLSREDGVSVTTNNATGDVAAAFPDGTVITVLCEGVNGDNNNNNNNTSEGGVMYSVTSPGAGMPTVEIDTARGVVTSSLPDGTVLTTAPTTSLSESMRGKRRGGNKTASEPACLVNESITLTRACGWKVVVDVDEGGVVVVPPGVSDRGRNRLGLYRFMLTEGKLSTMDVEHNYFSVSSSGRTKVVLAGTVDREPLDDSASEAVSAGSMSTDDSREQSQPQPIASASAATELGNTMASMAATADFGGKTTEFTPLEGGRVPAFSTHPPRVFLVREDGSGVELLAEAAVVRDLQISEASEKCAVVAEPLAGEPGSTAFTIVTPMPDQGSPGEDWVCVRQLVRHCPLTESEWEKLDSALARYNAWLADADRVTAGGAGGGATIEEGEGEGERATTDTRTEAELAAEREISERILAERRARAEFLEQEAAKAVARQQGTDQPTHDSECESESVSELAHSLSEGERSHLAASAAVSLMEQSGSLGPTMRMAEKHGADLESTASSRRSDAASKRTRLLNGRPPHYFDHPGGTEFLRSLDAAAELTAPNQANNANQPGSANQPRTVSAGGIVAPPHEQPTALPSPGARVGSKYKRYESDSDSDGFDPPPVDPNDDVINGANSYDDHVTPPEAGENENLHPTASDSAHTTNRSGQSSSRSQWSYGSPSVLTTSVTGSPRRGNIVVPNSIRGTKGRTNERQARVEGATRRTMKTSSVRMASQRVGAGKGVNSVEGVNSPTPPPLFGFELYPEFVDFGMLQEGASYRASLTLTNVGVDVCRFRVKEPPGGAVKVVYTPGPAAPGMQVKLSCELNHVAAGTLDDVILIETEAQVFEVGVYATILGGADYEEAARSAKGALLGSGVKLTARPKRTGGLALNTNVQAGAGVGPGSPSRRQWQDPINPVLPPVGSL